MESKKRFRDEKLFLLLLLRLMRKDISGSELLLLNLAILNYLK